MPVRVRKRAAAAAERHRFLHYPTDAELAAFFGMTEAQMKELCDGRLGPSGETEGEFTGPTGEPGGRKWDT